MAFIGASRCRLGVQLRRGATAGSMSRRPSQRFISTRTPSLQGSRALYQAQKQRPRIAQQLSQSTPSIYAPSRRRFTTTPIIQHDHIDPPKPGEELKVTFISKEGTSETLSVAAGYNLLQIAHSEELEMEGACEGSCACSTCHVIVEDQDMYDKMDEPTDEENDMLDLAFGLTETSRLGCQICMSKELDGLVVRLPSMTRNLQKSDFEGR